MSFNLENVIREITDKAGSDQGTEAPPAPPARLDAALSKKAAAPVDQSEHPGQAQRTTQAERSHQTERSHQAERANQGPNRTEGQEEDRAIVSKKLKVMGDLYCEDVLRIEGYVEGNIECRSLTVCQSASITGNIRAQSVNMSGTVDGTIEAGALTLNRSAIVSGDLLVHETLVIEAGAQFEGNCQRVNAKDRARAAQADVAEKQSDDPAPEASSSPSAAA
jgi:cytoskeletal protein CcmA (bactofilin family)